MTVPLDLEIFLVIQRIASTEDVVFEELRGRVMRGMAPMSPLRLSDLAAELGVSTMPVRAALRRLESEGFAVSFPRRGTFVAPLSLEDLQNIQAVRRVLEPTAAKSGASKMAPGDRTRLLDLLEQLNHLSSVAGGEKGVDEYLSVQKEMHDVVYAAARNQRLFDAIQTFRRMAERYVRVAMLKGESSLSNLNLESQFIDACLDGQSSRAAKAIASLLDWTLDTLAGTFVKVNDPAGSGGK